MTATKLSARRQDDTGDTSHWREVGQSRRRFRRQPVNLSTFVMVAGERLDCGVHNISLGGARISLVKGETLAVGAEVALYVNGVGSIPGAVQYGEAGYFGLMFLLDDAEAKIADLLERELGIKLREHP